MNIEFTYVVAAVIGVVATARLTRLLVADDYPPSVWVRIRWDTLTRDGAWSKLVHCAFCASPWIAAPNLAWAVLTDLHWSWWVFNGWLAASYLASLIVFWDEG